MRYPDEIGSNIVLPATTPMADILALLHEVFWCDADPGQLEWSAYVELRGEDAARTGFRKGLPGADACAIHGEALFAEGFAVYGDVYAIMVDRLKDRKSRFFYQDYGHGNGWRIHNVTTHIPGDHDGFASLLTLHRRLIEAVAQRFDVVGAHLYRSSEGFLPPSPPQALGSLVMFVADTHALAREYDTTEAYFAAWDTVEPVGREKMLVTRGLHVLDETAFKAQALERNVSLARAARPHSTDWLTAQYTKEEGEMIVGFESHVEPVAYHDLDHSLEFTCGFVADDRLSPSDLMIMLYYRAFGLGEAQPVERVLVTFPDERSARVDARLLRDAGIDIQYYADSGEIVPLAD